MQIWNLHTNKRERIKNQSRDTVLFTLPKVFFILMVSSLILWPLGCFVSIFFFDAPIHSYIDEICRFGMVLTIWLYPVYLLPLLRFMFQLSKKLRATWLYYLCPIVPILILRLFLLISTIWLLFKKFKLQMVRVCHS